MRISLFTILLLATLTLQAQNLEWAKAFGGPNQDFGNSISVDAWGNVYTTGYFRGTADFDPGPGTSNLNSNGGTDVFVVKTDISGNFIWAKAFGGSLSAGGTSICIDASGNVYTTGYFRGTADFDPGAGTTNLTSNGDNDFFVQKMDTSGNFLWARAFGSTSLEQSASITTDTSGNVYIAGNFGNTIDFDPGAGIANLTSVGDMDVFVLKLDSSGNFLWAKSFGGISGDYMSSISVDNLGNVYNTGVFGGIADFDPGPGVANFTSAGNGDIFVQKMDASGNFLWAKTFGGSDREQGFSINVGPLGNVYTTGVFNGTVDFDPGAGTTNLTSAGNADSFIQKMDASGNFLWVKTFGGWGWDYSNSINIDASGNVYTAGSFQGTVDFDPGPGTTNLTSNGASDIFIQKMDTSGNLLWAKAFGDSNYDVCHSTSLDASGNVYATGYFVGTVDFEPGAGTTNLTAAGSSDIFVQKMSQCPSARRSDTINACGPYQWIDGNTYSSSTNAPVFTTQTVNGCDSVVNLNLTIDTLQGTDIVQACDAYQWIDGNTYTTSTNTPQHTMKTSSGCDSTVTLNLTMVAVDNSVSLASSTLIANETGGTYKWYDCGNGFAQIQGETSRSFTPLVNGSYAVLVGKNNCALLSDCIDVINVGTPVDELGISWNIFPNPTEKTFFLEFKKSHPAVTVHIHNALGQEVYTEFYSRLKKTQLEIEGPSGIYTVVLEDNEGRRAIQRLLKR